MEAPWQCTYTSVVTDVDGVRILHIDLFVFYSFYFEGRQCTVQNYFKEAHKKPLSYPNLPCLCMDGKNPSIYIPLEVCYNNLL